MRSSPLRRKDSLFTLASPCEVHALLCKDCLTRLLLPTFRRRPLPPLNELLQDTLNYESAIKLQITILINIEKVANYLK